MTKLVSYSFSKKDRIADRPKPSVKPNPDVSRRYVRGINGYELKQDNMGNYFYLKPSPTSAVTRIQVMVPYEHANWLMSIDDSMLTDDQKVLKK